MELKINIPIFARKEDYAGVYMVTLDTGHFYIGGAGSLRKRFGHWSFRLRHGIPKNKNMKTVLPNCKEVISIRIFSPGSGQRH